MENNQAETAFLLRTPDPARFGLRWFTPTMEVPLCGHATLASAHILLTELFPELGAVTFDTLSGPLGVSKDGTALTMNFPSQVPHQTPIPKGLEAALGVSVLWRSTGARDWAARKPSIVRCRAAVCACRLRIATIVPTKTQAKITGRAAPKAKRPQPKSPSVRQPAKA